MTSIPIAPKPEPVGSGARALGQSAFIAVADDATAASWNPAGLINLERAEVSFVGALRSSEEDYSMANPSISSDPESWSDSQINFMSYAQPLQLGNTDVVLSVNYHQVYNFGVGVNTSITRPLLHPISGAHIADQVQQIRGKSEGAVSAYTLAGGLSIPDCPEITIGAGINWYAQRLLSNYAWKIKTTRTITTHFDPPLAHQFTTDETFDDFRGQNYTLGLLWDAYEKQENLLTFGLVYHTAFTAGLDYEVIAFTNSVPTFTLGDVDMDIDFPRSFGAGVNYRFSDSLSAAFDVEWKEWSKYTQEFADETRISLVDEDALTYRLGGEYLFLEEATESVFACRGGLLYESRPAWGEIVPVYGFSAGFGWTMMDQYSLDFAYQYRLGEQDLGNTDYKIKEGFLVASLITYF